MFWTSSVFLCCILCLGVARGERLDIFLINITIFQTHETSLPFTTNHPEVYLSCNDGRPKVNLDQVRRTKQLYQFRLGDINATSIYEDGCVACKLKESDGTALLRDDEFGSWSMCQSDFEETGVHNVEHPGEFEIDFQCPDCVYVPEPVVEAPASEPADEMEEAAPSSAEPFAKEDDLEAVDDVGTYYYVDVTESRTLSLPDGTDRVNVLNGEPEESTSAPSSEGGSGGISVAAVVSLCVVFLAVGVAVGVGLLWRFSASVRNGGAGYELVEMVKAGLPMKKSSEG